MTAVADMPPAPAAIVARTTGEIARDVLLLALLLAAMLATAAWLPSNRLFVDEYAHWPQAQSFARGSFALDPGISTWPTMNALVGWTLALLGEAHRVVAGRLVIVAFALLAAAGFLALARTFDPGSARLRTAQFFLSPVVLPFCALVYTDLPALAALLWAAVGAMRRQPALLFAAGFLACAFRQNNVVWFVALVGVYGWLRLMAGERIRRRDLVLTGAILAAWCVAVWLQGGVASGSATRGDHPGGLRGISNVWFACFVAALVYLPYLGTRLLREAWRPPLWLYVALGTLVVGTFRVTHRFNFVDVPYILHNLLLSMSFNPNGRGLFVVVVVAVMILVARTPFTRCAELKWPLLAVAIVSLLPFWLIEQRYYLPIYALLWAARSREPARTEFAQLVYGMGWAAWMVARIADGSHFV